MVEMPKVYRVMKKDVADDLPIIGSTNASELGARPGVDIKVDEADLVIVDGSGMSVVPNWRNLQLNRIPKRLKDIFPGASGKPSQFCFSMGDGPFQNELVGLGLMLVPDEGPDPVVHGTIAPEQPVTITQYQADLASTRSAWRVDEV